MSRPDVSLVLLAHAEGTRIGISLRNAQRMAEVAGERGIEVETLVVADRPNAATDAVLDGIAGGGPIRTDLGEPGAVRDHAATLATGRYLCLLDGGDLWSENWLPSAYDVCESDPGRVAAHAEVSWVFDDDGEIFFSADQADPAFDPRLLRVTDCWDRFCLLPLEAYAAVPSGPRTGADRAAYDDWRRHRAGVAGGLVRRVAPDTLHFVRRFPLNAYDDHRPSPTRPSAFLGSGWAPPA